MIDSYRLHPATRLGLALVAALAAALLAPPRLFGLAVLCTLLLAATGAWRDFLTLLYRGRWLWLGLAAVYALTTPGMPVWPALGPLSPSDHGLALGAIQLVRIGSVLCVLAWALHGLDRNDRVLALLVLIRPLGALGMPVERFAVRLGLVLDHIEHGRALTLAEVVAGTLDAAGPDHLDLPRRRPRVADFLLPACALAGLAALLWG